MAILGFDSTQMSEAAIRGTLKKVFRHKLETDDKVWKQCGFEEDETDKPFEEYSTVTGIGLAPRKEEFAQIAIDVPRQNYTKRVNVYQYAIMMPISEEAKRFRKYKEMFDGSEMVAESLNFTVEYLCADIFGNAFSTSYLGVDAKPLVSSTHKLGKGGTASNYIGAVSLSQSGLETALIQARKMPNDVGIPIGIPKGKMLIVCNEDETFNAARILKSTLQSDTANNTINVLKDVGFEVAPNRYLPSTSNWFLRHQKVKNSLMVLWEMKPDLRDHGDDKTRAMFFDGYQSLGVDFYEWRGVQGSDF